MGLHTPDQIKAHPIYEALNPHGKQFLIARLLPLQLNPLAVYGIDAFALVLSGMTHSKVIPAHVMLWSDYVNEVYAGVHTLVVDSSGNTVQAVARLASAYGLRVKAVMSTDVPDTKVGVLRVLGTAVDVFQVANVAQTTAEESRKPGHHHLDQYSHHGNPDSHERYTGPEILRLLKPNKLAAVAVAMGSGGTAYGLARCFAERSPGTIVVGVRPKYGEQVPGARDEHRMAEVVKFPWRPYVHAVEEVGRKDSFISMRRLWSAVEPQPGPTSGLAWMGLIQYLERMGKEDRLAELRGKCVAFFCPDGYLPYVSPTLAELDPNQGVM